jgi:hypothetical protein
MVIGGSWRIPPCIALKTKYKPFLTRCQKGHAKNFTRLPSSSPSLRLGSHNCWPQLRKYRPSHHINQRPITDKSHTPLLVPPPKIADITTTGLRPDRSSHLYLRRRNNMNWEHFLQEVRQFCLWFFWEPGWPTEKIMILGALLLLVLLLHVIACKKRRIVSTQKAATTSPPERQSWRTG